MLLPAFTADGLLPVGDHELTLDELRQSMLVVGYPGCDPHWDAAWRLMLVNNLEVLAKELWEAGIEEIFIDGSFVEDKLHPNDIDGYFVCYEWPWMATDLKQKLNLLNPHKIWTWELRWPYRGQEKPQLPMWHVYRVELFPHFGQGIRYRRRVRARVGISRSLSEAARRLCAERNCPAEEIVTWPGAVTSSRLGLRPDR